MAKKTNDSPDKPQETGGLPPELMVPGQTPDQEPDNGTGGDEADSAPVTDADPDADAETDPDTGQEQSDGVYVVVTGRCVQHDGVMYRENQQVTLDDADAARLLELDVVMTREAVQKKLAKANPPGTVTVNGR